MSFVRVGEYFFKPTKVVWITVLANGFFGNDYTLHIEYDMPRTGDCLRPTTRFEVNYGRADLKLLLQDVDSIISKNNDCLLGKGARTLLGHNNRE